MRFSCQLLRGANRQINNNTAFLVPSDIGKICRVLGVIFHFRLRAARLNLSAMTIRITGPGSPPARVARRSDKPRSAGAVFASHITSDETVENAGGLEGGHGLGSLSALLAVQGVDPDAGGSGKRRAQQRMKQRAEDLLDRLDEIRLGLLDGTIPKTRLAELARMMRVERDAGVDPHLAALLDEIELRAEVELAKLSRR